jgi:hypothetical protein
VRDAKRVRALLTTRLIAANPVHVASRELLAAEIAVAERRAAEGLALATAGLARDSNEVSLETVGYAAAHSGKVVRARQIYDGLANSNLRFGWEGTLVQLAAPMVSARLAQLAGYSAAAAGWRSMVRSRAPKAGADWPPASTASWVNSLVKGSVR